MSPNTYYAGEVSSFTNFLQVGTFRCSLRLNFLCKCSQGWRSWVYYTNWCTKTSFADSVFWARLRSSRPGHFFFFFQISNLFFIVYAIFGYGFLNGFNYCYLLLINAIEIVNGVCSFRFILFQIIALFVYAFHQTCWVIWSILIVPWTRYEKAKLLVFDKLMWVHVFKWLEWCYQGLNTRLHYGL